MESIIACAGVLQVPMTLSLLGDDAMISRARNTLMHKFLTLSDATHLLFIDADIGFPAEAPARLLAAGKDVVAGAYPIREHFWDKTTQENILRGEPQDTATLRYVGETEAMHQQIEKGPMVQTHYAGTGFMLISRQALERMVKAYPETAYTRIDAANGETGSTAYALFDGSIDQKAGHTRARTLPSAAAGAKLGGKSGWTPPSI
ncbi:hypothetical protein [Acetobacter okinawensis]|uniref:hypothetical protein n=1 Tax=Acetobacter okinawensis TaxID=1076594 RepID=UPI000AD3B880